MKKTICMILALLMCGAILAAAGVAAWASEEADQTDTPAVQYTAEPAPITPAPADPDPDLSLVDFGSLAPVGAIVILCFLVGEIVGKSPLDNKWTPAVCGVTGGVLGAVCLYTMPGYPANDLVTSVAVGVFSGLAATGADQVYKQLKGV